MTCDLSSHCLSPLFPYSPLPSNPLFPHSPTRRWSADGERVACGSSDRVVRIWDATTTKLLYALPGHKGSVNDVIFNPVRSDVVASCGSDKQIFIGELTSS